jgi:2-methylisocitrate lyase-like PEP mutase family enzyme
MSAPQKEKAARFRALHEGPTAFVIPNPWDAGSARILAGLGFQALAHRALPPLPPSAEKTAA